MEKYKQIERTIITTYRKRIWNNFVAAVRDYGLIKDGDRIAVCISGGKDSMLLAKCMQELKAHGKNNFELFFLVMDPGYSAENRELILSNAQLLNVPVEVFNSDIFDSVAGIEKSPCYLCARMRRGHLYKFAQSLGCNKIALGHHFDDMIETVLMSMLYNGQIQTMMPKLHSKNFEGMELIRPLYKVREADIINWKNHNGLRFLQCACRFTENCATDSERHTSKRQEVKQLIRQLKQVNPSADVNIFNSMHNVILDTVVSYKEKGRLSSFNERYEDNTFTD